MISEEGKRFLNNLVIVETGSGKIDATCIKDNVIKELSELGLIEESNYTYRDSDAQGVWCIRNKLTVAGKAYLEN